MYLNFIGNIFKNNKGNTLLLLYNYYIQVDWKDVKWLSRFGYCQYDEIEQIYLINYMHEVRWSKKENDGKGYLGVWTEGRV